MLNNLTDEQRDIIYNYNANCELKISYITVDKLMDIIKSLDEQLTTIIKERDEALDEKERLENEIFFMVQVE